MGRHLLARPGLAARGNVQALVRQAPAKDAAPAANVRWVRADLFDEKAYAESLAGAECVLHLAAATGKATPEEHFRVNVEGTRRIVEAAKRSGVEKFLLVSSIAAKFRDKRRYFYAQAKQHAEEIVRGSGLRYTIVRPTMIFGRGSPVLAGLEKLAALPVIPVFGDGHTAVQPVDVDDLADLLLEVVEQDPFANETLEFGGPEVLPIEDLLRAICRAKTNRAARVLHIPLGPVIPLLTILETVAYAALPITVGQLSSFRSSGAAESNRFFEARVGRMKRVEAMLRAAFPHD